jgi:RNA polymerase sigma-70 factor (ECF subfamily)
MTVTSEAGDIPATAYRRETLDRLEASIPSLRRYARSLVGSADRADDLVQDTLVRAIDKLHLWRPGSDMRAWLFAILYRQMISGLRRESRQPEAFGVLPDASTPPTQIGAVRLDDLRRAFERLHLDHRAVLHLVAIEQMSYEEAAAVLQCPVGTVRSRLSRARAQLRLQLGEAREAANEPGACDPLGGSGKPPRRLS